MDAQGLHIPKSDSLGQVTKGAGTLLPKEEVGIPASVGCVHTPRTRSGPSYLSIPQKLLPRYLLPSLSGDQLHLLLSCTPEGPPGS